MTPALFHPRTHLNLSGAAVWFAASYGAALVGYLALNGLASRLLGAQLYGSFVIIVTITMMVGQLGVAGAQSSGLRDAARLREEAAPAEIAKHVRAVRAVTRVLLPAVGVGSAIVASLVANRHSMEWPALALCVGILVILGGQQKLWANYLRGFGHLRLASLLEGRSGGALVSVTQACTLLIVFLFAPGLGLVGGLGAMAFGFLLPPLLGRQLVMRRLHSVHVPWRPLADLRLVLARGNRFALLQTGTYMHMHIEIWVAGALLSNVAASHFGGAQRLALLVVVPLTVLQVVLAPAISRLYASGHIGDLGHLLRGSVTVAVVLVGFLWLPLLIAPSRLLTFLFGRGYADAALVLTVLSLGYVARAVSTLCGLTLSMTGSEGVASTWQWAAVAVQLLLGAGAAAALGTIGLAVSAAFVSVAMAGILLWQVHRRLGIGIHPTIRPRLRMFAGMGG